MLKFRMLIAAVLSPTGVGIMLAAVAAIATVVLGSPILGPKAKLLCYGIGAVAIVSIALYVWNELQKAKDRERLSEYLSEGTALLDECLHRSRNGQPPTAETNAWIESGATYISERLGRTDLLRFRDAPPSSSTPFIGPVVNMQTAYWIDYCRIFARIEVLKKLIDEQR